MTIDVGDLADQSLPNLSREEIMESGRKEGLGETLSLNTTRMSQRQQDSFYVLLQNVAKFAPVSSSWKLTSGQVEADEASIFRYITTLTPRCRPSTAERNGGSPSAQITKQVLFNRRRSFSVPLLDLLLVNLGASTRGEGLLVPEQRISERCYL